MFRTLSFDGKTSRRSVDGNRGLKALHLVSAWASENGLVLGQVKCSDKGGEIAAMETLLNVLDLKNVTVTMDAMGCQKKLAAQIIQKGGHYMLAAKGNQGMLHEKIKMIFEKAEQMQLNSMTYTHDTQVDKGHGRVEQRDCTVFHVMYAPEFKDKWVGLNSLIKMKSEVFKQGQTTIQTRYYISSLPADAAICAHAIRQHWGVENSLHWCLDMSFMMTMQEPE
nr:ISAs1 family transposase [Legionella israelensis]